MAHSHHHHREHQVSHRRVHKILQHEPAGAKEHMHGHAFSQVTSKTAAEQHDKHVAGKKGHKRYARGGHVKHSDAAQDKAMIKKAIGEHDQQLHGGKHTHLKFARGGKVKGHHTTNIVVVGHRPGAATPPVPAGPAAPPVPMGGAAPPMMPPPGMPMRARGGKVADGESTKANIKKMDNRAARNSEHHYFRGGAATGVGREEKAEHMKRKG